MIMNYEQKYEEVKRFIKDLYPHMSDYCKEKIEGFFSELKESEDEDKIMKELIYNIIVSNDNTPSSKEIFSVYSKTKEDALAWLEKQGDITKLSEEEQNKNDEDYEIDDILYWTELKIE